MRFAVRVDRPNSPGPRLGGDSFPINVVSPSAGPGARLASRPTSTGTTASSPTTSPRNGVTVETLAGQSTFWDQPAVSFLDTGLTPGPDLHLPGPRRDPWGNAQLSNQYPVTVAGSGAPTTYANRVLQDGPALYWRLGEAAGSTRPRTRPGCRPGPSTP